jgi:hypothetical protein
VVLISVVLHGFSPIVLFRKSRAKPAGGQGGGESLARVAEPAAAPTSSTPTSSTQQALTSPEFVSMADVKNWRAQGTPFVILDSRSVRTFDDSDATAEGAVRAHPDHAVKDVEKLGIPKEETLVVFCA